ncbi:HNH endonuclease [Flexivirga lutea]
MNDAQMDTVEGGNAAFDASTVRAFQDRLDAAITSDDMLTEIRALEEAKNAISARQARLAVAAHHRQRQLDIPRGINRATTARKVGSDIALARRSSPHLGSRLLGLAHAVVEEMPHTCQALTAGVIGERDATELVAATACLSREDRASVDAAIADELGTVSHRRLVAAARAVAYEVDPQAATARRARAESERRVSLRPAPDCMTWLTALLPVKDGVACYAALTTEADATATADHPRGQVMADTLVQRVTGRDSADGIDVHVNLLMPIDTLTGDTPAEIPGYGPVPADLVRAWATDPSKVVQVRRLFAYPGTGDLVGMESTSRCYTGLLADFIALRDRTCRTPYCDAPIRHTDHITAHTEGGATTERNAQGLCERCNYTKEHPDVSVTGNAGGTTTTTGTLRMTSRPPSPPGLPPPTRSHVERTLVDLTWQHSLRRPRR